MLSLNEVHALREFLELETPLQRAIKSFLEDQCLRYQGDCANYMASVPRDPERASDAAAHADAYATLLEELRFFADNQRV